MCSHTDFLSLLRLLSLARSLASGHDGNVVYYARGVEYQWWQWGMSSMPNLMHCTVLATLMNGLCGTAYPSFSKS